MIIFIFGILIVEVDLEEKVFYVYWINVLEGFERFESLELVVGFFEKWVRRLGR